MSGSIIRHLYKNIKNTYNNERASWIFLDEYVDDIHDSKFEM